MSRMGSKDNEGVSTVVPVKCLQCKEGVEEQSVECGFCGNWIHWKCLKLEPHQPTIEHQNVMVFCDGCKADFVSYKMGETGVKSTKGSKSKKYSKVGAEVVGWAEIIELNRQKDEKLSQLESKVDKLVDALGPVLRQAAATVSAVVPGPLSYADIAKKGTDGGGTVVMVDAMRKMNQEDMLKKSVVIKGLQENGNDLENVKELCRELDISSQVVEVFRMGVKRKPANGNRTLQSRLLKVHLASSSCQKSILNEARNLRASAKYNHCFIRKSMTREERDALALLYRKRDEMHKAEPPDSTTKFAVIDDSILKFTRCQRREDGSLGRGARDYSFKWQMGQSNSNDGKENSSISTQDSQYSECNTGDLN